MIDARLPALHQAASHLFMEQGYKVTQVGEIAKKAGIATGSIYNLFSGKKAILTFTISGILDPDMVKEEHTLPIREMPEQELFDHLTAVISTAFMDICSSDGIIVLHFPEFIEKFYDFVASYQMAFNIIEKNQNALPLVTEYYYQSRQNIFDKMNRNLQIYMKAGEIRELSCLSIHVSNIIETIANFAMHLDRYSDESIAPGDARETAIDLVLRSYRK